MSATARYLGRARGALSCGGGGTDALIFCAVVVARGAGYRTRRISCYPADIRFFLHPSFGGSFMRASTTASLLIAALLAASSGAAQPAQPAQQPPKAAQPAKKDGKPAAVDVAPLIKKLETGEETQVREALDEIRIAGPGGAAAGPAIAKVLSKGATLALTESAIETLADIESESGS